MNKKKELLLKLKTLKSKINATLNNEGIGVIEIILILLDNPFTSSTYILSY